MPGVDGGTVKCVRRKGTPRKKIGALTCRIKSSSSNNKAGRIIGVKTRKVSTIVL